MVVAPKRGIRTDREMLDLLREYKTDFKIKSKYFDQMIVDFEKKVAIANHIKPAP